MKRDGHTHTRFCLHGSGEETEDFILKAIEKGFEIYSTTEHLPYPDDFLESIPYSQEMKDSLKLRGSDFGCYIREIERLKKKYRDSIRLLVGSEIDFLPDNQGYTRQMLKEYGPYLEDSLLSVHFIRGDGVWRAVDESPADFEDGLISCYSTYEEVQLEYYRTVKEALLCDLGPYKPKRISHLTLCNKFQLLFNPEGSTGEKVKKAVLDILEYMRLHGYSLDVNVSGLYKVHCREIYPSPWIIELAGKMGIPLVYGSDSHAVDDVGRGYEIYESLTKRFLLHSSSFFSGNQIK
ncbi:MAG: histidinol-phosphatase HisJ [Peptococcaceae bacterium]|jgi:histidinol-phosphatase (PHP family)|nr:histidinol-phosphatase HisJ [Peptococcaceae bacterium]MDH7523761.1 histidinol-phosphatase HisJ [Peptococcaceae bacterium]